MYIYSTDGKNGFAKVSKNLAKYMSENNKINQNNYVEHSNLLKC